MTSRWFLALALTSIVVAPLACGGNGDPGFAKPECSDGKDNDMDGTIDFPDDLSCSSEDDTEGGTPDPQCRDGRDNDGDGKIDYPMDPGCFAPNQDDEVDDCPDGPSCPQCSNGKDDDGNSSTDWPADSAGCDSASDNDEYTRNPAACGSNVMIKMLPFDGHKSDGMLTAMAVSSLNSPACGGSGGEDVYELRINAPKVVVATTDSPNTTADTVLYIRGSNCSSPSTELSCNDDVVASTNKASTITQSISTPGTYYLVVDAHDAASVGPYDLTVKFFVGEGTACIAQDDCGPGLICRVPKGGTTKVCSKHVCEDNVDEDNDGKNGYPQDPGCVSPTDDDETDGCPGVGPNCPECGDGVDNDSDGKTDYGTNGDTTCSAASNASESCVSTDGVVALTQATTNGTTVGAVNDVRPACAALAASHTAPDKTYRLDLPAMASLTIDSDLMSFDGVVALYNSTCAGTELQCSNTPEKLTFPTGIAAGTYYYVVDGYSTGAGTFPINISGRIQNGASCESVLAQSGAITCNTGYACKGTAPNRTCQPAKCSDGVDNDSPADGKIDFPFDPGCTDPADDDETDPATPAVCSDGTDNDTDGTTDYPNDFGCAAAGGNSEVFCMPETDMSNKITTFTTTGTTAGKANDLAATASALPGVVGSCSLSSTAPEVSFALQLPVPVATLQIDSSGSAYDTVLVVRDVTCATALYCDDDGGPGTNDSLITMTGVQPGTYAIAMDGYSANNGAFTLHVKGTVSPQTPCSSPLFSGGANAVLACPTGTTCQGSPLKCIP